MKKQSYLYLAAIAVSVYGVPCYKQYESGRNYITNSLVSQNGINYQAEWGTQNVPGSSDWDGWDKCGTCDVNEPLEFQTAWPAFKPVEGGVQEGTRVSWNGHNYIAAYPTVEHPSNANSWSDAGPCVVPIDGELGSFGVDDNRKYASCQNYADGGKFYEFRISQSGELHYWVDKVYKGVFAFNQSIRGSKGVHFETEAKGTEFKMPPLSMVGADNNRVIVKSRDSQKTYWACLVDEYPHDFKLKKTDGTVVSQSVPGHFTVVNPDYGKSGYTVPKFQNYPFTHFGTTNFYNPLPFSNDGLKDAFGENFHFNTAQFDGTPDLADIVKKQNERLFGDAMGAVATPCVFFEIGANPPRNRVSLYSSQMTDEEYQKIVYEAWTGSFSDMLGVLKEELIAPNEQAFKDMAHDKINSFNAAAITQDIWDKTGVGGYFIDKWFGKDGVDPDSQYGGWQAINNSIQALFNSLNNAVDNLDMDKYVDVVDKMHLEIFEMFRDVGYSETEFNNIVGRATGRVMNEVLSTFSYSIPQDVYDHIAKGHWDDVHDKIINPAKAEAATRKRELAAQLVAGAQSIGSFAMKMDSKDQSDPKSASYWVKMYGNQFHNYFTDLEAPGKYFGLKDTCPYPNQPNWNKQKLDILEVYDVGVGNPHRYEHTRKHNGGELQNFFKEYTVEEYKTTTLTDGSDWTSFVDGNGFNDGTCNFYMLAKVRTASNGSTAPNQETIAVLWLDEQEYFSERWRVAHPLDANFEGLTGNLLNMFPVLSWEDGADLPDFVKSYWAPFMETGLIDDKSRVTTSRYAVAVSGVKELYTTAFFWATTDSTWRARRYPNLDTTKGEYLDRSSVQIRDDQTIYIAGRKNVDGKIFDGYFYQRLLPNSNDYDADPVKGYSKYGQKPKTCDFDWRFVEKSVFEVADGSFFRMGVYDTAKTALPDDAMGHDVYNYRGYNPRVHVLLCQDYINVPNGAKLLLTEQDGKPYVHPMYKTADDWNKYDGRSEKTTVELPKVYMRAVQVPYLGQMKTYLVFEDRRNDDLGAFLVNSKTPNVNVKDYTYKLVYNNSVVANIASGYADNGITQVTDLNVWSDAPLDSISFSTSVEPSLPSDATFAGAEATRQNTGTPNLNSSLFTGKTYATCAFNMPRNPEYFKDADRDIAAKEMARYLFKKVNIGIINPNTKKKEIVAVFNIANTNTENPDNAVCYGWSEVTADAWSKIRESYLSEKGLVKYATTIWAEDYFGNGNTFTLTNDKESGGVDTGDGTVVTKDIGVVNSTHYIQPGKTVFKITQYPNWKFKSAVFGMSGLSTPLNGEIRVDGQIITSLAGWYKAASVSANGTAPMTVEITNSGSSPFLLQWWVNVNR